MAIVELAIERFAMGVTEDGIDAFLVGVDLYVDGLDYFALDIRRKVLGENAARIWNIDKTKAMSAKAEILKTAFA